MDRSQSPSRDIARSMIQRERSSQKKRAQKKVRSPTKRLEQMKNAHVKNATIAASRPDAYDKMIYTVSPTEGYLVKKEYGPGQTIEMMHQVEQDIAERIDDYI